MSLLIRVFTYACIDVCVWCNRMRLTQILMDL